MRGEKIKKQTSLTKLLNSVGKIVEAQWIVTSASNNMTLLTLLPSIFVRTVLRALLLQPL